MLELLIGVIIFAFALTPFMNFGSKQTSQAYSIGKHVVAGQIAASLLDNYLSFPFEECRKKIDKFPKSLTKVINDPEFMPAMKSKGVSGGGEGEGGGEGQTETVNFNKFKLEHDLFKGYQFYDFKVEKIAPGSGDEGKMFLVQVSVSWLVNQGDEKSRQDISFSALKFNEGNVK